MSDERWQEKRKKQRPILKRSKEQIESLKVRDAEYLKQLKLTWGIKNGGEDKNERSGV